jgi:hypothetical protein
MILLMLCIVSSLFYFIFTKWHILISECCFVPILDVTPLIQGRSVYKHDRTLELLLNWVYKPEIS